MIRLVLLLAGLSLFAQTPGALRRQFASPPEDARAMVRWWWFGPSVTKPQLEREMTLMKAGGFGGFEVQPTYPLALDEMSRGVRNLPFLSSDFLSALRFTSDKALQLGLRFDLTLGNGWPYGGPQISVDHAAARLRVDKAPASSRRVPVPDLANGEQLIAAFEGGTTREFTDIEDGILKLPADAGREVWFFIASRTGQMVKRASVGGEGYVLDHYSKGAAQRYLNTVGSPLLKALARPPRAIFCDSLEVYGGDWTPDFLTEFRKRRGYDLKPLLPALVTNIGPKTSGIRHDWGQTLTELVEERFLAPLQSWAKTHNTQLRIQNYGIPPVTLSSNAYSDLPEGEGHQWKIVRASRWASSASHIYGRPVTSSETWTWLHSPVFRATPLDMKAEADIHFLQGINQLIGHGWPYTSEGVEYPGWRFYAAAVFNEKNPWWNVMPDLNAYLQRISFMLRQGEPANDIALYLPNDDAWSQFSVGKIHMIDEQRELMGNTIIPQILESGYNFDFFDDTILAKLGKIEGNFLRLGASKYRAVIIPPVNTMPVATLAALVRLSKAGGIVLTVGHGPASAPGANATQADHEQIKAITAKLKNVLNERQLGETLTTFLPPDVLLNPANPEIGFIHRSTSDAQIYFLANTSNRRARTKAAFRVTGKMAEMFDPVTGSVSPAPLIGGNILELTFEPYESKMIVFSNEIRPQAPKQTASSETKSLDISDGWSIAFGKGSAAPMQKLVSWTDNEETKYFSGVATYTNRINVPAEFLANNASVRIDFGEGAATPKPEAGPRQNPGFRTWLDAPIREAAVVYVNGKRAGSVWCPPYTIEIARLLHEGKNEIRIEVANLAVNYMSGRPLPNYRLLNLRYGSRFEAQDMDKIHPEPAGILGRVRLVTGPLPTS